MFKKMMAAALVGGMMQFGCAVCSTDAPAAPEKKACDHAGKKGGCDHGKMDKKGGCDHGKMDKKGGCDHGKMGKKGGCDHGKMGKKGGCDHGKKAAPAPAPAK